MKIEKNNILHRQDKKPVLYDLYYKENGEPKPVIIFCHGYKGFKDWGAWGIMAREFAKKDYFFIKFNFSHNGGTIEQPIDFPDLEAFAENNYTKELEDLEDIINLVLNFEKNEIDTEDISLIGHSRGGGIVLIKTQENKHIKKVVTLAGVSDYKIRFLEGTERFTAYQDTGKLFTENSRTKQMMWHNWQFYEDFVANEERLTISKAAKQLKKPFLIIHGTGDTSVPMDEAEALHKWNPASTFKTIEGANHVFGTSHPWEKEILSQDLREVVAIILDFLK